MELREYQTDAIQNIRKSISAGNKRVSLMLSVGSGKTVIAASIVKMAVAKNKRVWFICDNVELVEQTINVFEKFGLDVGVIQGIHDKTDYSKAVQVVTAQTITRRWQRFDANMHWLPDLVLIDESHVVYQAHKELMTMLPNVPVIGLSATPFTRGLGKIYQDLIVGRTTKQLIESGHLSKYIAYGAPMPDLKGVAVKTNGDYLESSLEKKYNTKTIVGDIVKTWLRLGENRQTLVFCVNIAHSVSVANAFDDAGVPVAQIDGRTNKEMRKKLIADYKAGEITVICNVGVLTKGFDAPETGCIVLARPTKSLMLSTQIIGRGLRSAPGKENCIILDHSGNIERNGFPDDDLPDYLCDGTKGNSSDRKPKDELLPKPCPSCGFIKAPGLQRCPACGFEIERQAKVNVESGDLRLLKANQKRNKTETKENKQKFYSGLLRYAIDRGYKEGWAANKYRERFSVWPNAMDKKVSEVPGETVLKFIQSGNIRYAHRR